MTIARFAKMLLPGAALFAVAFAAAPVSAATDPVATDTPAPVQIRLGAHGADTLGDILSEEAIAAGVEVAQWGPPPRHWRRRRHWRRPPPRRWRRPPPRRWHGGRAHVNWCLNRYRSYNPRTDRFLGYDGRYHRCRSPYR